MKLKIADEKLDELANQFKREYTTDEIDDNWATALDALRTGFRAAEQAHQVTVDTLMKIIDKYKEASRYISESKSEIDLLEAADKLMKELKEEL